MDRSRCIPINLRLEQLADEVAQIGAGGVIAALDEGILVEATVTAFNFIGAIVTATAAGAGIVDVTVTGTAGSQNLFETIAVAGQASIVADSTTDTFTIAAGANITLTTNSGTDTLTVAVSGLNIFDEIAVSGQTTVAANGTSEQLTLAGTGGIVITTNNTTKTITIDGTSAGGGGGGSGHNGGWGTLDSDLTIDMDEIVVNVGGYVGSDPGATVTAKNPPDPLNPGKYLCVGNSGGRVNFTTYNDQTYLEMPQWPITRPVAPP